MPDAVCFDNGDGPLMIRLDVATVCKPSCGDGKVNGSEHCDDGNLADGDGCSSACLIEAGYLCTGYVPSTCAVTCGDAIVAPGEGCDDGNLTDGDGCSRACAVEPGYRCATSPPARFFSFAPVPDCVQPTGFDPAAPSTYVLPASQDVAAPVPVGTYTLRYVAGATDYKYSPPDPMNPSTSPRYGVWAALVDKGVSYAEVGGPTLASSVEGALQLGQALPATAFTVTDPANVQAALIEAPAGKCPDNALGLLTVRIDMPSVCDLSCLDDSELGTDTGCAAEVPYCQGAGTAAAACQPCIDTSARGADLGCSADAPACVQSGPDAWACTPGPRYGVDGGGCAGAGTSGAGGLLVAVLGALSLGRRRRSARAAASAPGAVIATLVVAVVAAVAAPAHAQVPVLDISDFPVERFRIAFDRNGVLDAEWAEAPAAGSFDAAIWMGYADAPLVLVDRTDGTRLGNLVDYRLSSHVTASYVVRSSLQVGLEVPLILGQDTGALPADFMDAPSVSGTAVGDARLAVKATLLHQRAHGVSLAVIPAITVPSGGGTAYRGERTVTFAPEVAVSRSLGARHAWRLALDAGYRARGASQLTDLDVDDELFAIAGAAYRATSAVELALATSLATAASSILGGGNRDHAEALAGVTVDVPGPLVVTVAGGMGLSKGFGTPDWRGVLALRFDGMRGGAEDADRDHDGLADRRDGCPDRPEDIDGFEDDDGCPDLDNDGDGIADAVDRCPGDPETVNQFDDGDGCPDVRADRDRDGIIDAEDGCPDAPEDRDGYQDGDGCPDADNDGDGILDAADGCPLQAGPAENRGCPDTDADGDGVVDRLDRCQSQPGPVENRGCPDNNRDRDTLVDRLDTCPDEFGPESNHGCKLKPKAVITATGIDIVETVYFKLDKDIIERQSYRLLDNVAQVLGAHPTIRVRIEGHTDDQGDDSYNLDLSTRRAASVRAYLIRKGVDTARLESAGFGETRPIASNQTRQGRAKNRRVVFTIIGYTDESAVQSTDGAGPGAETIEPGNR